MARLSGEKCSYPGCSKGVVVVIVVVEEEGGGVDSEPARDDGLGFE